MTVEELLHTDSDRDRGGRTVARPRLSLSGVRFRHQRRGPEVLADFSHTFQPGVTLLLGPNGAGKSTLLSLAASAVMPAAGSVKIGDLAASGRTLREYRRSVAWMPQDIVAIPGFSARDQIAYHGWLKGMSRADAWQAAARALDRVGLSGQATTQVARLSGGQRRRVGVGQALVHGAAVILMDEPTVGLDPVQRREFFVLIDDVRSLASVLISTHQVEDIDRRYDHVDVLCAGQVTFSGTVGDFLAVGQGDSPQDRVVAAYERALEPDVGR